MLEKINEFLKLQKNISKEVVSTQSLASNLIVNN